MKRSTKTLMLLVGLSAVLGGCSTVTPDMHPGELAQKQWVSERKLVDHVQCQLGEAVRTAAAEDKFNAANIDPALRATWLHTWGAKVSLVIALDDKAGLTPGVTLNDPLENAVSVFAKNGNVTTAQSRNLGFGGTLQSEAIRTETIGFFYSFADLLDNNVINFGACDDASKGQFLSSDLKISDFIRKGMDIANTSGVLTRKPSQSPYDTFTYEVKFIVTKGASITPMWKLLRVSADQSGTLFAGSTVRTDDLTITMGKVTQEPGKAATTTKSFDDQHLADLIGQSVSNALQGRLPQ